MNINKELYPILAKDYALVRQYGDSIVYPLNSGGGSQYSSPEYQYVTINRTAAEILSLCDGNHTIAEIVSVLCSQYCEKSSDVYNLVLNFLHESLEQGHILFQTCKGDYAPKIYGDFKMITPINACIEITKQCPLRCRHCYNESGTIRTKEMTLSEVKSVLEILSNLGVQKLMITGGEPTYRTDFIEIVEYACSRFIAVSIASNGYLITEDLAHSLSKFRNKVVVQISIDGIEEHHNKIRCVHDSYKKAMAAIKFLRNYGIAVTVATTLNAENFSDMEEVADAVHKVGALQLSFAITTNQGRARNNQLAYGIDLELLVNRAIALKNEYLSKGLFVLIEDDTLMKINATHSDYCGAGASQIAIRENGDVAPCLCFFYTYGNLLRDDINSIFNPQKVARFRSLPSPSLEYCGDCAELENCQHCPARAYDSKMENCKWKKAFYDIMHDEP